MYPPVYKNASFLWSALPLAPPSTLCFGIIERCEAKQKIPPQIRIIFCKWYALFSLWRSIATLSYNNVTIFTCTLINYSLLFVMFAARKPHTREWRLRKSNATSGKSKVTKKRPQLRALFLCVAICHLPPLPQKQKNARSALSWALWLIAIEWACREHRCTNVLSQRASPSSAWAQQLCAYSAPVWFSLHRDWPLGNA